VQKCLQSLQAEYLRHTHHQVKVVVVDNHSQDGSPKLIKKEFPWAELIELENNVGFSAGNNVALSRVESEYVMLLNSDTELTNTTNLDKLIQFMDKHEQAAVVTPKVLLPSGELDWASHRGEPALWAAFTYYAGLEKRWPQIKKFSQYHQAYLDLNSVHQIDACSGAAMLIRTKHMNQVGLLDERFFMYAEDLDWCKRFREAGYQIWFMAEVEIIHHKYKSGIKTQSPLTSLQSKRHFYNTMLQYYDKHYQERYPGLVRWILRVFLFIKKGGM